MSLNASKVAAALRQRFPGPRGPQRALRALGLDADLLVSGGGKSDSVKAMRLEIEQLLGELNLGEIEVGKLLMVLDKYAPLDTRPDNHPQRELASDDQLQKIRVLLRAAGMSEADIEQAMRIANVGAGDYLPEPATPGGRLGTDAARATSFEARHAELVGHIGGRELPGRRREIAYDFNGFRRRHPEAARVLS